MDKRLACCTLAATAAPPLSQALWSFTDTHLTFIQHTPETTHSAHFKCLKTPPLKKRSRGFRRQRDKEGKQETELHPDYPSSFDVLNCGLSQPPAPGFAHLYKGGGGSLPGCGPHEIVLMCDSRREKGGTRSIGGKVLAVAPRATKKIIFF